MEIIDQFTEEDWEKLFSDLDDKNDLWKEYEIEKDMENLKNM